MKYLRKLLKKQIKMKNKIENIHEQVKFKREVNTGLLLKKSIAYRIFVTCSQMILAYALTNNVEFSIGFSLLWNVVNTIEYFGFDYVFSRYWKIGKNGD